MSLVVTLSHVCSSSGRNGHDRQGVLSIHLLTEILKSVTQPPSVANLLVPPTSIAILRYLVRSFSPFLPYWRRVSCFMCRERGVLIPTNTGGGESDLRGLAPLRVVRRLSKV